MSDKRFTRIWLWEFIRKIATTKGEGELLWKKVIKLMSKQWSRLKLRIVTQLNCKIISNRHFDPN